jgi:hypothetical protein
MKNQTIFKIIINLKISPPTPQYQIHPKSLSIILDKAKEGLKEGPENKSSWQIKSSVSNWPNPSPIALHQASCPGGHYCKLRSCLLRDLLISQL